MVRRISSPLVLLLIGCASGSPGTIPVLEGAPEDTSTDVYDGPYRIAEVQGACADGTPDRWSYTVSTEGWADEVELRIAETSDPDWPASPGGVRTESHLLANTAYDSEGTWDAFALDLLAVVDPAQQESGATTGWDCSFVGSPPETAPGLAWMAIMYGHGAAVLDCAIWGRHAEPFFARAAPGLSCTCRDPDEDCTD